MCVQALRQVWCNSSVRILGASHAVPLNRLLCRAGGFSPLGASLNSERKISGDLFWQTGRSDKELQRD